MPRADLCPECRAKIHPFAASCACGADLDAYRRRRLAAPPRRFALTAPLVSREHTDLLIGTLLLLALALFAPLFGALFSLLVVWHANHNGPLARRNLAVACAALSVFNLVAPTVLLPHLFI